MTTKTKNRALAVGYHCIAIGTLALITRNVGQAAFLVGLSIYVAGTLAAMRRKHP